MVCGEISCRYLQQLEAMRTGFVRFYHSDRFDDSILVNLGCYMKSVDKLRSCYDCENIHFVIFYQNANEKLHGVTH